MGLSSPRIGEPMRGDRLLLVSAFAMALLTMLGATGESLGMDRLLKSNTSKTPGLFNSLYSRLEKVSPGRNTFHELWE